MSTEITIFIVDDDADVRDSLRALLESADFDVADYDSAKAFLAAPVPRGGCVIADIRMPDMDGLEMQEELAKRNIEVPVIVVTGHGDVPLAVRAMKAGAADFIEKPYDDEVLLGSVRRALASGAAQRKQDVDPATMQLIASLTPREREVLEHLIAGRPNKVIAFELGISPRTVEIHRAHLMDKMRVRSLPELVRVALAAGVVPADGK
jgi:two-component system response regulator FixJ